MGDKSRMNKRCYENYLKFLKIFAKFHTWKFDWIWKFQSTRCDTYAILSINKKKQEKVLSTRNAKRQQRVVEIADSILPSSDGLISWSSQ